MEFPETQCHSLPHRGWLSVQMNAFYRKEATRAAETSLEKAHTGPWLTWVSQHRSEEPRNYGGCEANQCINNLVVVVLLIL